MDIAQTQWSLYCVQSKRKMYHIAYIKGSLFFIASIVLTHVFNWAFFFIDFCFKLIAKKYAKCVYVRNYCVNSNCYTFQSNGCIYYNWKFYSHHRNHISLTICLFLFILSALKFGCISLICWMLSEFFLIRCNSMQQIYFV